MEEKNKKERLNDAINEIKRILEEVGVYDASLFFSVEKAASDLMVYRKIRDVCMDDGTPLTFTEKSREGDDRIKPNPLYEMYRKQSGEVGDALADLLMNVKSKGKNAVKSAGDKLMQLMNDLKGE